MDAEQKKLEHNYRCGQMAHFCTNPCRIPTPDVAPPERPEETWWGCSQLLPLHSEHTWHTSRQGHARSLPERSSSVCSLVMPPVDQQAVEAPRAAQMVQYDAYNRHPRMLAAP